MTKKEKERPDPSVPIVISKDDTMATPNPFAFDDEDTDTYFTVGAPARLVDLSPKIKFVKTHKDAQIPEGKTLSAAGMDLCTIERVELMPGCRYLIDTGLKMELPPGYEAQIRPRSGLAWKHGVTVLNSPGTIDADYRGNIKVILINHGSVPYTIMCPNRIAQMVIAPVLSDMPVALVGQLSETKRGEGGFGHTGK